MTRAAAPTEAMIQSLWRRGSILRQQVDATREREAAGAIVTVEPSRVRVRPAESDS